MDFEKFLSHQGADHKGRTLNDIWGFSDEEIEGIHDFIQLVFPTNKKSQSVFHGLYLDNEELIETLRANQQVRQSLTKSSLWFLGFLQRNNHWKRRYDHNQLRITRAIESLRLLVSNDEADSFRESVLSLLDPDNRISERTLDFWMTA